MKLSSRLNKFGWHAVHKLTGKHLSKSTFYYNWAVSSASFLVSMEKIRPKIHSNFQLIEISKGITIIILRAIQVLKAQGLSPYNEFSVEVPILYRGKTQDLTGSLILYMPVTSEEARWGGVEIVGLPKFLADISLENLSNYVKCRVRADDRDVIFF